MYHCAVVIRKEREQNDITLFLFPGVPSIRPNVVQPPQGNNAFPPSPYGMQQQHVQMGFQQPFVNGGVGPPPTRLMPPNNGSPVGNLPPPYPGQEIRGPMVCIFLEGF